ncbi:MAG: hypothetical protein KDA24_22405 [Deltaproteobacteria bacterium]|nr:hypothetical protein [Deltaproteobacteria bacterium]
MALTVSVTYDDIFGFVEDYRTNLKNLTATVEVPSPVAVGDDVNLKVRVPIFEEEVAVYGRVMAPMGNRAGLQLESGDSGLARLDARYTMLGKLVESMLLSGRFKVVGTWAPGAAPAVAAGSAGAAGVAAPAAPGLVDPYTLGAAERSGDLNLERVTDLLMSLYRNRETGVIEFRTGTQRRLAYVKSGGIVQYISDPIVEQHCLGVLLARAGRVTPEQLEESLEKMNATGEKQGQVLVEMGVLTFPQLVMSLMTQVDIISRGVLAMTEGSWQFWSLPKLPSTVITPPMKTPAFFFAYFRKKISATPRAEIEAALLPHMDKYVVLDSGVKWEEMRLKRQEAGLIEILGAQSYRFREVFSVSNTGKGLTEQVLLTLLGLGLVDLVDHEDQAQVHNRWSAQLEKKVLYMRTQNPFEILETHWTSRSSHVEKSYQRMKAEYESFGRGANLPPEAEKLRAQILERIEEAYRSLKDTSTRQETRKKFFEPMQHEFSAELMFKQAEMLIVRELWSEALDNLERAIELKPREGKYRKFRDMAANRVGGGKF